MPRSFDALINPQLLIWARDTSGLSMEEAARKIGVSEERLKSWEAGEARPTVRQLRDAAKAYRRPFAAFYLPEPPATFRVPHDFRTFRNEGVSTLSSTLRHELRRVSFQRSLAVELTASEDAQPVSFLGTIQTTGDIERSALLARQILGIPLADQIDWPDQYAALNGWRRAFEDIGVLVFQTDGVDVGELRGFSIPERVFPVIAANGSDSPYARVFTLFHEYAHLLINESGLCDMHSANRPSTHNERTEKYCNALAAAALLPKEPLFSSLRITQLKMRSDWNLTDIQSVASMFGTSREVVLLRLVSLGAAPFEFFLTQQELFRREYAQLKERQKARDKEKGRTGGPLPSVMAVRRVGPSFARIVLNAYDREEITTSDLTEYLGVRIQHVAKIRKLAFAEADVGVAD